MKSRFDSLVELMSRLRGPAGCPWDREQSHQSLKSFLIEEAYEVNEAIEHSDFESLREELGDLLLQIVFHAQIAKELGKFDIGQVLDGIIGKLVRRHPHVFEKLELSSSQEVIEHWNKIKAGEKDQPSLLAGIPSSLPALLLALKIQARAAKVGFDWEKSEHVLKKLKEEVAEFEKACSDEGPVEAELGDLLFTLVNIARHFNIDPEEALRKTIKKFKRRFEHIERKADEKERQLKEMSLDELDSLWDEAKEVEQNYP